MTTEPPHEQAPLRKGFSGRGMRPRSRDDLAVQRGQHDHRRFDPRATVLEHGDQSDVVAIRDRRAKSGVGGDHFGGERQLREVRLEDAVEDRFADVELALELSRRVAVVCRRNRRERDREDGREQHQERDRNARTQLHTGSTEKATPRLDRECRSDRDRN
jgi:hypothetical protein